MKLSTIQIMSIIKSQESCLEDNDLLYLLHDELDFDVLLPVIFKMKFHDDEALTLSSITPSMLMRMFRSFPRLLVWMFINKEDKLRDYLGMLLSYEDVHSLLSMQFSKFNKVDVHLRSYLSEFFEKIVVKPSVKALVYRHHNNSSSTTACKEAMARILGDTVISRFEREPGAGLSCTDIRLTPQEFVDEFKVLTSAPLIVATQPASDSMGFKQDGYRSDKYATLISTVRMDIPVAAMIGRIPELPKKYLDRVSAITASVHLYLDATTHEYLVIIGTDISTSIVPYTKYSVRSKVDAHIYRGIKSYLDEQMGNKLSAEASGVTTSFFQRSRAYGRSFVEYNVLHFPMTIIESIK